MKLLSVNIFGQGYRGLRPDHNHEFNYAETYDRLEAKIFAGLNGSGKSNFLEVVSEIFYFLHLIHLPKVNESIARSRDFGFSIEYVADPVMMELQQPGLIPSPQRIRIKKELGELPEFSRSELGDTPKYERIDYAGHDGVTKHYLPKRILAYSSGQNELLSNPYYKFKLQYFRNLNQLKEHKDNALELDRMIFLDYDCNQLVFVSNMLLGKAEKLQRYKEILDINELKSFRITLNFKDYENKRLALTSEQKKTVQLLKRCATAYHEVLHKKEVAQVILDLMVNQETKLAFQYHFGKNIDQGPFELFKALYELSCLNVHRYTADHREMVMNAPRDLSISEELPPLDPDAMVFRLENVLVEKSKKDDNERFGQRTINYNSLSDGEHQFALVVGAVMMVRESGSMFLYDEPNTHFNPMWRAKMISLLNDMSIDRSERDGKGHSGHIINQEIIITTHSPFIISDSYRENVYKFENGSFKNPEYETFGGSVNFLLENIFDRKITISDFAHQHLKKISEKVNTNSKEGLLEARKSLSNMAESFEKFNAFGNILEQAKQSGNLDDIIPPKNNDSQLQ